MKNLILILSLVNTTVSYGMSSDKNVLYSADTMGKFNCDPVVLDDSLIKVALNPGKELLKQTEEATGYSECVFSKPSENSSLMVCQKPMVYKTFSTIKMAECHMFLKESKEKTDVVKTNEVVKEEKAPKAKGVK